VKKLKMLVFLMLFAVFLEGCGKSEKVESPTVQVVEPEEEEQEESEEPAEEEPKFLYPVIENHEIDSEKVHSYLTGEAVDASIGNRRPIAVMIPNNKDAQPQYGISKASVVYEACVEGRITRLMGIFEDFDDLDHIGPVRSSRDYYVYTALEYDAIYCHWGLAVPYVADLLNSEKVDNISQANQGVKTPTPEAFDRISRSGYKPEFTGYLFIDKLKKGVEKRGYSWDYEESFTPKFTFAADGTRADYAEKPDAVKIYPGEGSNKGGYGGVKAYFEYNASDGLYYRYQHGGKHIDEINGKQLAVSNVVFQYCHGEVRDSHDYLAFGVHGEGDCIVFTNGKMIKGRWYRYDGDDSPAKYFDEDGNEIIFNQGKTWVCNIWQEYGEAVSVDGQPVSFDTEENAVLDKEEL